MKLLLPFIGVHARWVPFAILAFCTLSPRCFADSNRQGPTQSVADSKQMRVFVAELGLDPSEFDLGDTVYRVREAWIEHPFVVRPGLFHSSRRVENTLTLCLIVMPVRHNDLLARAGIRIKYGSSEVVSRDGWFLFQHVGSDCPPQIAIRCDTRDKAVVLSVVRRPNKSPETNALPGQ